MEKQVAVTKEGAKRHVVRWFNTVRQAERFIARLAGGRNRPAVERGDYGIDASEKADAAYQRLRNAAGDRLRKTMSDALY
jgi:hypothetical protein